MERKEIERLFQYNMTNAFIEWDKAVNTEYNEDNEKAFYEGAYAAQKYLIEKAHMWLVKHTTTEFVQVDEYDDNPDAFVRGIGAKNSFDFIMDFVKVMEE